MELVRKLFDATIASLDEAEHTVTAIVSTDGIDRDREVVLPSAFAKSLPQYMRNAVHGWAHDYSRLENILGRAVSAEILPNGLKVTFRYAVDTPSGLLAWQHIKAGNISAYSVGFMPVSYVVPDDKTFPQYKGARRAYTEVDLWEIALCAVPCQPEALVVGRSITNEENDMAKDVNVKIEAARVAKQHPAVADIAARLHAAANTIEGWSWMDDDCELPDPAVCTNLLPILQSIMDDIAALVPQATAEETAEGEMVSASARRRGKAGQVLSTSNQELVDKIHGCLKEASGHCEALKAAAGMTEGDDTAEDGAAEGDQPADKFITLRL